MGTTWRLLDTGVRSAAENMALDEVILSCHSEGLIPDTLRFLRFSPHCALVGYHQSVELEVEEEYCRQHGIEINRRITGGGNLYWDEGQLGWEIYASKDSPVIPGRIEELYRFICEAAVTGLQRLGVEACYRPKNDIEVGGRKISGTGGTEKGPTFLYQGSLLTDFDVDTMMACLKLPLKKLEKKDIQSFRQRVTCLREVLGTVPRLEEIKEALADGFAEVLGVKLVPEELTDIEKQRLAERLPYFQSDLWVRGARPRVQDNTLQVVDYRAPGGLIRVSVRVDQYRHVLKTVFISGDFFAYPERSILDLEAALKNTSSHPKDIEANIRAFFTQNGVQVPGVSAEDFIRAIIQAMQEVGEQDAAL
ncbi:lipoate--protein ligase family protein [Syntrophomonas erecta]